MLVALKLQSSVKGIVNELSFVGSFGRDVAS